MHDDDQSARIHLASQDPAFPALREMAYQTIVAEIDRLLAPQGYALKGSTWTRTSAQGRSAVHLQRSRYGWDVQVVLRFLTPEGTVPATGDWAEDEDLSLGRFVATGTDDPGRIAYLDVTEDPDRLARLVEVLSETALPWLDAHHGDALPFTANKPET